MPMFAKGDQYLDSDAVFGVQDSLLVKFSREKRGEFKADYDFVLLPEKRTRTARKRTSGK